MRQISISLRMAVASLLAGTVLMLAGCGKGANTEPTITARPATSAPAAGGGTAAPAAAATTGAASSGGGGGVGTFKGTVKLTGSKPSLSPLVRMGDANAKDAAVCAAHDVPDESLIVGANGGVKNVFVYLRKSPGGAAPAPTTNLIFDQKNCLFIPHCLVVRVNQPVQVLNDDAILHNTHNFPSNPVTEAFNKAISPNDRKGIALTYAGTEDQPVKVVCDIHNFMSAYHLPVDHEFVALTDDSGNFEIKNLPAGTHEFVVWHERPKQIERRLRVTITGGQTTERTLEYPADTLMKVGDAPVKTVRLVTSR